jgi:predicted nuclease of restriction endonuclease-like RecB superfamily
MAHKKKRKPGLWSRQSIYERADGTKVVMDSSWEHICATKMDEVGIAWIRGEEDMHLHYYTPKGNRKRKYIPDFYLPDFDLYLEIKGFYTMAARHKMADVQRRNDVNILMVESMPAVLSISRLVSEWAKNKEASTDD